MIYKRILLFLLIYNRIKDIISTYNFEITRNNFYLSQNIFYFNISIIKNCVLNAIFLFCILF